MSQSVQHLLDTVRDHLYPVWRGERGSLTHEYRCDMGDYGEPVCSCGHVALDEAADAVRADHARIVERIRQIPPRP